MAIKKQEFYEGAALHQIACNGAITRINYRPPLFLLNDHLWVLLKYCTKNRSPWSFTFGAAEQELLTEKAANSKVIIGLVCGGDGIAALDMESYLKIAAVRRSPIHIACYRKHGEHYQVSGPDGSLDGKVPPSRWKGVISLEDLPSETS